MERTVSKVLQDCLSNVDPETKARIGLEMECLAHWDKCHEDILEQAYEEGIDIDWSNPGQRYMLVNLCKYFYIKGIDDAYNKLKEYGNKDISRSTEKYL